MLQFSLRTGFLMFTLLSILVGFPSLAPLLPAPAQAILLVLTWVGMVLGFGLLPLALLATLSVCAAPDEQNLKSTNLRRCLVLILLCLLLMFGPPASFWLHDAVRSLFAEAVRTAPLPP